MEAKGLKTITNLLSKTAGLVFFSFLAISLGVVFGLLFEGWVKDQPGTPVGTDSTTLETVDLPIETIDDSASGNKTLGKVETLPTQPTAPVVHYKVRVGPYTNRNEAMTVSKELQNLGYPVYVAPNPPYAVQVGAFGTQSNAERLQKDLTKAGYKVYIEKE
ncbi:MAG TPA: SPOR domain-containing protein [Bacillota bacterium]|nr:SPOR domain-containing protein [Bacillota bacterium]HPT86905.1 SPOR domain-containing protein [Bacillota bacterium]